ncbi:MAG TPA: DUF5658 family protein [Methanomicrobiales archaeon]|nr:DUF5658 family protein [Methanomicrobiales archaeon]
MTLQTDMGRRLPLFGCILGFFMWLDVITTEVAVRSGLSEHNPFMEVVVGSPVLHLLVKTAVLVLIVLIAGRCERTVPTSGTYLITILTGFYLAVLVNNLYFLTLL